MNNEKLRSDKAFLDAKRRELTALREQLLGTKASARSEEADVDENASGEAREFEDDAQKLVTLELEGSLEARDTERLVNIERALRKIDEGTYGLSDASGEPIPIDRLNAVPDAIYTLAEQEALDKKG
jgi:DnaK suppressor protein